MPTRVSIKHRIIPTVLIEVQSIPIVCIFLRESAHNRVIVPCPQVVLAYHRVILLPIKFEFNELTVLLHLGAESLGIVAVYLAVSICHLNFCGTPEPIIGIRCISVAQQVSTPVITVITRLPDITCNRIRVVANCGGLFQFLCHPVWLIRPPVQFLNSVTVIMAVCLHNNAVHSTPFACQAVSGFVVAELLREQSPPRRDTRLPQAGCSRHSCTLSSPRSSFFPPYCHYGHTRGTPPTRASCPARSCLPFSYRSGSCQRRSGSLSGCCHISHTYGVSLSVRSHLDVMLLEGSQA